MNITNISKKNTIALIDSGVDTTHPRLRRASITGVGFLEGKMNKDFTDTIGHGTSCAVLIHRFAPEAHIHAIKIFNRVLEVELDTLELALIYCIEQGFKVVNLSLGITMPNSKRHLQRICQKAIEKNIVIIAANSNNHIISYPAGLKHTIGITSVNGLLPGEIIYQEGSLIEFGTSGIFKDTLRKDMKFKQEGCGSSFAAPVVSAFVHKLIVKHGYNLNINNVRNLLKEGAVNAQKRNIKFPKFLTYQEIFDSLIYHQHNNKTRSETEKVEIYVRMNQLLKEYEIQKPIFAIIGDKKYKVTMELRRQLKAIGYKVAVISDNDCFDINFSEKLPDSSNCKNRKFHEIFFNTELKRLDFTPADLTLAVCNRSNWKSIILGLSLLRSNPLIKSTEPDAFLIVINYRYSYFISRMIQRIIVHQSKENIFYLLFSSCHFRKLRKLHDSECKIKSYLGFQSIDNLIGDFILQFSLK